MNGCAFESIVELVGDRWSLYLIGALLDGPRRTTELVSMLAPISTRTLADRLKRLESAGALVRRAYAEAPPRVEYALTDRGRELRPVLTALRRAAAAWDHTDCREEGCRMCDLHCDLHSSSTPQPLARRAVVDVTLL
jgi:DNA-binding HxlR family transcriptional regulator